MLRFYRELVNYINMCEWICVLFSAGACVVCGESEEHQAKYRDVDTVSVLVFVGPYSQFKFFFRSLSLSFASLVSAFWTLSHSPKPFCSHYFSMQYPTQLENCPHYPNICWPFFLLHNTTGHDANRNESLRTFTAAPRSNSWFSLKTWNSTTRRKNIYLNGTA